MKITELKMTNWMAFKGIQSMLFPQRDDQNILLVFAENNHGKTCLATAIEWCLYGSVKITAKKITKDIELLNDEAQDEDEKELSVELTISDLEKEYIIKRSLNFESETPSNSVELRVNGRPQSGDIINGIIEDLIPRQISHFFLFDGELLEQFVKIVGDESGYSGNDMKESIERNLGIPILSKAARELNILKKKHLKKFNQRKNLNQVQENLALQLTKLDEEQTQKTNELEEIEEQYLENEKEINNLSEQISGIKKIDEEFQKLNSLRSKEDENKDKIEQHQVEIKKSHANAWTLPLLKKLKPIASDLAEKRRIKEGELDTIRYIEQSLLDKKKSLDEGKCSMCQQDLDPEKKTIIEGEIRELEQKRGDKDLFKLKAEIEDISGKLNNIDIDKLDIKTSDTSYLSKEIEKLELENNRLSEDIGNLKNKTKDFDEAQNAGLLLQHEARLEQRGIFRANKNNCASELEDLSIKIKGIREHPSFSRDQDTSIENKRMGAIEDLIDIFELSVNSYRDKLRMRVSERANLSFKKITTEKEFEKLEINENYNLDLIVDGKVLNKGKGAEQIIALCLIEAINHLGRKRGPMLMDTPLARLDLVHRTNLMNYFPTCVTQLIVLAHSGEIEKGNVKFEKSRIGKRYTIERVSAYNSKIVEMNE